MDTCLYLSLIPESLVVSMLPPAEFGAYLATGTRKRAREQAIYFEVSEDLESEQFALAEARQACVSHEDGEPKHSVYVSVYRVLEHVPLETLGSLWLATRDGRTLELKQAALPPETPRSPHLYQELCPVHPVIASSLGPVDFCRFITNPEHHITVPKICFVELGLGGLAADPVRGDARDLPYKDMPHLRDCLRDMIGTYKATKTVNRIQPEHVPYRCVKTGFFVGQNGDVRYYPFPSVEEMERDHHEWWRSAALS